MACLVIVKTKWDESQGVLENYGSDKFYGFMTIWDEIEKAETSRDKVRRFSGRSRGRKRPKFPQQSCVTAALLPEVLIEGNSYSEIQTIASNTHGEIGRKTRRCVARSVSWLLFFSQRLQGGTCRHYGYSKRLSPRMGMISEAPQGKHVHDSESKTMPTGENFWVALSVPEYRHFIAPSGLGMGCSSCVYVKQKNGRPKAILEQAASFHLLSGWVLR